jgi:hypothetical protein
MKPEQKRGVEFPRQRNCPDTADVATRRKIESCSCEEEEDIGEGGNVGAEVAAYRGVEQPSRRNDGRDEDALQPALDNYSDDDSGDEDELDCVAAVEVALQNASDHSATSPPPKDSREEDSQCDEAVEHDFGGAAVDHGTWDAQKEEALRFG